MNYRMFWWNIAFTFLAIIFFVSLIMTKKHWYDGFFVLGMFIFAIALSPFNGTVIVVSIWVYMLVYAGLFVWFASEEQSNEKRSERFNTNV